MVSPGFDAYGDAAYHLAVKCSVLLGEIAAGAVDQGLAEGLLRGSL